MEEQENLHNEQDVNPGTQQDQLINGRDQENLPDTDGTGANRSVQTAGTVVIKDDEEQREDEDRKQEKKRKPADQ